MLYRIKKSRVLVWGILMVLIVASLVTAVAAANIVPVTHMTDQSSLIAISELTPPECNSIRATLERLVVCSGGVCDGSNANELILGTAGSDTIDGKNGEDCIVGGGGDDMLSGDNGNDILVGGSGSDVLDGGKRKKDTDTCVDNAGSTTFIDCEIVQ